MEEARSQQNPDAILEEFGDLLFTMVGLARHLNVNSEQALRLATRKFESRIRVVTQMAREQGIDLTIATDNEKMDFGSRRKPSEPNLLHRIGSYGIASVTEG